PSSVGGIAGPDGYHQPSIRRADLGCQGAPAGRRTRRSGGGIRLGMRDVPDAAPAGIRASSIATGRDPAYHPAHGRGLCAQGRPGGELGCPGIGPERAPGTRSALLQTADFELIASWATEATRSAFPAARELSRSVNVSSRPIRTS